MLSDFEKKKSFWNFLEQQKYLLPEKIKRLFLTFVQN